MTAVGGQAITEPADGVVRYQSSTWSCNALSVVRGDDAVVVDACWTPDEVSVVRAGTAGAHTHLLVTHADVDHVSGVVLMPDAVVVAGRRTLERIRDGAAARALASEFAASNLVAPGGLRVDLVIQPETEAQIGCQRA